MKNLILLCVVVYSGFSLSQTGLVIANQGGSAATIVTSMLGGGLTVNNAIITCPSNAYGTFTNGASTNLGIPSGIVLTTGNVNNLNGTGGTLWSVDNPGGNCNDPQLYNLEPEATFDCCILEFDVVPSCTTLRIRFVFGSEEYPEWVSQGFNDAFGFFVTGQNPSGGSYNNTNVATLPNNTTIVSIDNVNATTNSTYYVNNSNGTFVKLDAFTTVLTRDVAVTPCQSYHFKLAIADAGDGIYDSGVFIDFLDCVNSVTATNTTTPASCAGNDGTATANVSAGYPPYTYSWNTTPAQTTATATGLAPGTYTVTVDDAGACTPPLTQTVTVTSNASVPTLAINSTSICSGQSATLTATPSALGGTYLWSPDGQTTQSITVSPTSTTTYSCVYNLSGCNANGSGTVTVNSIPTVSVNSTSICSGESATLTATTNSSGGTYLWNPGGATTNSISVTPSSTTTYSVVYSLNGCNSSPGSGTVTVNQIPTVSILENPAICQGQSTTLTASPSVSGGTYLWTPENSTTNPVTIAPSATTVYTVVYTLNGCVSSPANATVTVNPNISVNGGQDISVCQGGSVTLTASGTPTVSWSNGIQDGQSFVPSTSGSYVVTGTSANGCITTDTVIVTVNPLPLINAGNPQTVCVGQQVTLSGSGAGAGGTYVWSNGIQDNTPFTVNGTTTYTVTGTDANGCSSQAQVIVTGLPLPNANFSPDVTTGAIPLTVNFTNTSTNANSYTWDFGNGSGTNTLTLANTSTVYSEIGVYTVWLVATNGYCDDSTSTIIDINIPPMLFVPNVFTPNEDGSNPTWMVQTVNMASIDLIILNRWGNVMAKIEDLNGGWDGKNLNGSDATEGTYFYKYEAKALNGEEFSGHGFLTLIR